jgi:hypothetical protein
MKCVLIQANGNNVRLGKFFKQPKYELFYNKKRIIEHIIENAKSSGLDVFVALREGSKIKFNTKEVQIIYCKKTETRAETLRQCFDELKNYDSIIIHDCDVIIDSDVLIELDSNSLAITNYKFDGLKYGFIELDKNFNYIFGNEKIKEEAYITIGAYSVSNKDFSFYLKNNNFDSLLEYYNSKIDKRVVFSKKHINLGDIKSYFENL